MWLHICMGGPMRAYRCGVPTHKFLFTFVKCRILLYLLWWRCDINSWDSRACQPLKPVSVSSNVQCYRNTKQKMISYFSQFWRSLLSHEREREREREREKKRKALNVPLKHYYFKTETISVTGWLDFCFNVWPFTTKQICTVAYKLCQRWLKKLTNTITS